MVKVDSWEQAKLLFEMGKGLREISRQLDLPVSSLSRKSKDWKQGKLEQPIQAITRASAELEQSVPPNLMPIVQQEISEQLALIKSIQDLDKGALNLHGIILKKTISKAMSGEMSEQEASRIAQSMGLSVDKVAARAGIGREPQTQVNIQNNANSVADANLEDIVRRVLSSDDENDIISQLEESC